VAVLEVQVQSIQRANVNATALPALDARAAARQLEGPRAGDAASEAA
jgi:hypothetical protein